MYEKILVPLDCSDLAEIALPYAEEFAGSMGSKITLIHVSESWTQSFSLVILLSRLWTTRRNRRLVSL